MSDPLASFRILISASKYLLMFVHYNLRIVGFFFFKTIYLYCVDYCV